MHVSETCGRWAGSPSRAAVFVFFLVCGVSSEPLITCKYYQHAPSHYQHPSLPDRLHRPDAETPPKHKSSFKVQGILQLALQQTTPWASGGTGWSLQPQPWLLRLQWVPDGLELGGCLSSLPDLTRAVASAVTPAQAQRLGCSTDHPSRAGGRSPPGRGLCLRQECKRAVLH